MDINKLEQPAQEQAAPSEMRIATPAAVLDLNPTAFVDDLSNAVELHCATAFDELDSALRMALLDTLTPEQLAVLFQGTASAYQDLRTEVRRQLQAFEEYALEEILKVPAGLMVSAADGSGTDEAEEVTAEEEAAVEAELRSLRQRIAASKRRTREKQAANAELERLMKDVQSRLNRLEPVPGALARKDEFIEDVKAMADKGLDVETKRSALGTRRGGQSSKPAMEAGPTDGAGQNLTDAEVEREILRRQAAVKNAPAEDLRAFMDQLGLPKKD